MLEAHLNLFDLTVLGIMGLSCLFAFFRGFVREILSLGAWIGAAIVTLYYFEPVGKAMTPYFKNPNVATGVGTLVTYIGALIGFSLITRLILKFLKEGSDVGLLDNTFGLFFGAFRGAFIISLAFFLATIVMKEDEYPKWLKQSQTRPYVERGAIILGSVAPKYLREISSLQDKIENKMDRDYERRLDGDGEPTAYNRDTSRRLDRLIDSTDRE